MPGEPRTRYTRAIEVGIFEDKIGFTLTFDEGREHFLFTRQIGRELALALLTVLDRTTTPSPPKALGITVTDAIRAEERLG